MPKIKTLKGASKRFRKIAENKYKYKHANMRHILTKKSTKNKRNLRHKPILSNFYTKIMLKMLPYT